MSIFKKENLASIDSDDGAGAERHTVMIVDDKESNVSVMAAILRPHFHLIEARDGQEALRLVEEMASPQSIACIVSDHRMPKLTGVELFERILPQLPDTRRILVTGYMDLDAIVDAINKAQVHRFIAKPFEAADFLLSVRMAVAAFERQRLQAAYHGALEQQVPARSDKAAQLLAKLEQAKADFAALEKQAGTG